MLLIVYGIHRAVADHASTAYCRQVSLCLMVAPRSPISPTRSHSPAGVNSRYCSADMLDCLPFWSAESPSIDALFSLPAWPSPSPRGVAIRAGQLGPTDFSNLQNINFVSMHMTAGAGLTSRSTILHATMLLMLCRTVASGIAMTSCIPVSHAMHLLMTQDIDYVVLHTPFDQWPNIFLLCCICITLASIHISFSKASPFL